MTFFLMGKVTISMAIVNSYVTNYQRVALRRSWMMMGVAKNKSGNLQIAVEMSL